MNGCGTADRRQRHVAALRALSAAALGLRARREDEEEREIHQISNSRGSWELGAGSWEEPGGAIETNAETQQNRRLALPCRALPCLVRDMAWLQTGPSRLILCCVQWSAANESGRATNAHDRTGVVLGAEQSALRGGGAAVVPMGPMAWASKNRRWWRPALP